MPAPAARPHPPLTRYALVDVDSCFAACERVLHPGLVGRPVVVLSNNDGCVIARSQEAKALGVAMGTPWFRIATWADRHGVVARSSNYELYGSLSRRIMEILGEYTASLQVYSIDEAFLLLRGTLPELLGTARRIRARILHDLGMPVSVGIAPTRTLAKLASHGAKHTPALGGVASTDCYSPEQLRTILATTPIGDLWGVGRRLEKRLRAQHFQTALDLSLADPHRLRARFGLGVTRTSLELRGVPCVEIGSRDAARTGQVMFSRSFSTPVTTSSEMHQVLSVYAQNVTRRLRAQGSEAGSVWAFAATSWYVQPVHQIADAVAVQPRTDNPVTVLRAALGLILPRMIPEKRYVRAGISLGDLAPAGRQPVLEPFAVDPRRSQIGTLIDEVNAVAGKPVIGLGYAALPSPPDWQMRREMRSNRGTTHWDELTTVRAG